MKDTPIHILCGNFGSGKSELAIAFALASAQKRPTALVDLDVVNPYFRSAHARSALQEAGVRVIAPPLADSSAGMMTLPAEVSAMFDTPGLHTILDVGGDPAGAVALGQFAPRIKAMGYAMDYVINIRRPLSADAQAVLELMEQIEISARLLATGLINNTNLAAETTPQDILDGQAVVDAVGARRKLPLSYITAKPEVLAALPEDFQARYGARFFALTPRMRMPWLDEPLPMDARTRTR